MIPYIGFSKSFCVLKNEGKINNQYSTICIFEDLTFILGNEMFITHVITDRVEQHSAHVLSVAVPQAQPTELTFGPHTETTATHCLGVQSLLSALVTWAALGEWTHRVRKHTADSTAQHSTARHSSIHGTKWVKAWRDSRSLCPKSCLCCGTLCCRAPLWWYRRLISRTDSTWSSSFSVSFHPHVHHPPEQWQRHILL